MKHRKIFSKIIKLGYYKNIFSVFFLTLVFFISVDALVGNKYIPEAEIHFTETSQNSKISGSIMPASCESYPTWGTPHFTGDTAGYCSCPADGRLVSVGPPEYTGIGNAKTCVRDCPSSGSQVLYNQSCPINNSTCSTVSVPATITAGGTYTATISFYNNGGTTWDTTNYKMGSQSPQDNTVWGTSRLGLASNVAPGGYATLSASGLPAPATPGTYTWAWKMLREGTEWFGATCSVTVQVVNPPTVNIEFR
jgi:hypothetical protein